MRRCVIIPALLLASLARLASAQVIEDDHPHTQYDEEKCDEWIGQMIASDDDSSNGLSHDEYLQFLSSIDEPPGVSDYFDGVDEYADLPFGLRIMHKVLACHCVRLGAGEGCCEGSGAEIPLAGLDEGEGGGAADEEYRYTICQQISYSLTNLVTVPTPAPVREDVATTGTPTVGGVTDSPVLIEEREPEGSESEGSETEEGSDSTRVIIISVVVVVVVVVLCALAVMANNKKEKTTTVQPSEPADPVSPLEEPAEDDESAAPSVLSEPDEENIGDVMYDDNEKPGQTAGSALAAMGASSTFAVQVSKEAQADAKDGSSPNKYYRGSRGIMFQNK